MSTILYRPTPYSYSTAVKAGDTVYLALHRGFGEDLAAQLDGTFNYIRADLAAFGLGLESLVKVNVWLKRIEDLPAMEKQFAKYFDNDRFPARMTATTEFFDPDCLVMVDGIAYAGQ